LSNYPVTPLTPEQQQRLLGQVYSLLGKQVQSYHRHRHMGNNSSVPMELAQELLESIDFTLQQAGGIYAHENAEKALRAGQLILTEKQNQAKSLLKLVSATAPRWQTECRWEALRVLAAYLDSYDPLHLAHRGPEELFYPVLVAPPEGIQGIDEGLFYLNILWFENQILASVPENTLSALWNRLPCDTLNQCEQLLVSCMGKCLIGSPVDPILFTPEEHLKLVWVLSTLSDPVLCQASSRMCDALSLRGENVRDYACAIESQIKLWAGVNAQNCQIESIFL